MNCKRCDYALWNLRDRICPECGQDFYPSQFEFTPRTVRFLCPHCQQQYFGTDERGHLVPRAFNCVKCTQRISMDEMILLPAEGVQDHHTKPDRNPWVEPGHMGFFRRWMSTLGRSLTSPSRLVRSTPAASSGWKAFFFAARNLMIAWILSAAIFFLIGVAFPLAMGGSIGAITLAILALVVGVLLPLLWLMLWVTLTHFTLRISGPLPHGFRRTMHCICYSCGPCIIAAIPCGGI